MKKWEKGLFISFLSGVFLVLSISFFRLHQGIENKVLDFFFKITPKEIPAEDLILINIEEEIGEDGLWPWRNDWLVYLINYLDGLGTKAVLVDSSLRKYLISDHYLLKPNKTGTFLFYPEEHSPESDDKDLIVDKDNKVRRYNLKKSLILNLVSLFQKEKKELPEEILIKYNKWPYQAIETYSYFDLVISIFLTFHKETPKINFSRFKNRICIIGLSPSVINKVYPTPLGFLSSLEIRLQVLNNLIKGNLIHQTNRVINLFLVLIIFALSSGVFFKIYPLKKLISLLVLIALYFVFSFSIFYFLGLWIDIFLPIFSMVYVFLAISVYQIRQYRIIKIEEKRKELAKRLKEEILTNREFFHDDLEIVIKVSHSREAEGDFFDIIKLDENRYGVLFGEAPGKNLETVNYITKLIDEFRLQAPMHTRPRGVLNAVNNVLFTESIKGMFATCVYFVIDIDKKILSFANAGHECLLLAPKGNQEIHLYEALDSTPLGIARNIDFTDQDVSLNDGDLLVSFTSGVVKIKGKEGKEFGIENFKEIISQYRTWHIQKLANKVFERIHRFCQGQDIYHEYSIVLVRLRDIKNEKKESEDGRKKITVQQIA